MGHVTVWIDHKKAHIFNYTAESITETEVEMEEKSTHEHLKKFYHNVAHSIGNPNQLLIVGPGIAKEELKNHFEKHHHANLVKIIVGIETMKDHPTKPEILEVSKKFFDHHFNWHNI